MKEYFSPQGEVLIKCNYFCSCYDCRVRFFLGLLWDWHSAMEKAKKNYGETFFFRMSCSVNIEEAKIGAWST